MTSARRSLFAAAGAVMVAFTAPAARAQMPESYRALQIRMLETERNFIMHMIDSMPAQYFREKATPAQRDFGQQLYHAASAFTYVIPRFEGVAAPTIADTVNGFDKTGLKTYVNAVYSWAEGVAGSQPAADREAMTTFFGSQVPKWQVWDEMHQHTIWTLGQTVANFRMHGMPPAAFMFF
jgi:hypothetical protein